MALLQDVARRTAGIMGRESAVIRSMRPLYESLLDGLSGGKGVASSINGATYRIDPRRRAQFCREYDPQVAELLARSIQPGAICFDVGANVGIYVLQLAHWSRPSGRVVAFEPNPGAREVLEKHVELNGIGDRVRVESCAVGSAPGESLLYAADSDGMSRLGAPNRAIENRVKPVRVQVITLDDYCEKTGVTPDVVLIDIEGFEIAALAGAARLVRRRHKDILIVVEMHPAVWDSANTTRTQAESLLRDLKMLAVPLTGQRDPLGEYGQVRLEPIS